MRKPTLAERVSEVLAERDRWLAPLPTDLPDWAKYLHEENAKILRQEAADNCVKEIIEARDLLRAHGMLDDLLRDYVEHSIRLAIKLARVDIGRIGPCIPCLIDEVMRSEEVVE